MRSLLLTTLCAAALFSTPLPVRAQQVQRCTTLSGDTVYSDKRCEDIGAIDRLPDMDASQRQAHEASGLYRSGCSRTLSDLVYQITAAVDAKDVNRLASVYQWSGVSNQAANRILDRLEAVVRRPLVDIVPVRPAPTPLTDESGAVVDPNLDGYYPRTATQPRPIGLRLEQTLANGSTPSSTVLYLRRNHGCFWLSL